MDAILPACMHARMRITTYLYPNNKKTTPTQAERLAPMSVVDEVATFSHMLVREVATRAMDWFAVVRLLCWCGCFLLLLGVLFVGGWGDAQVLHCA